MPPSRKRPATILRVVPAAPEYAERQSKLMERVYGGKASHASQMFTPSQFRHHTAVFPEGQFVALHGDKVVGLTVSMRIRFDPAHPFIEPWWDTVGAGWLRHLPNGDWLYGVESCVHPSYQGRGIGGVLIKARTDTARLLNLKGMVAGSTLLDYQQAASIATPEEYVQGVIAGRWFDTNLSKQLKKGFRAGPVIPDYVTDPTALGWGAIILWDNPDYNPHKRSRKRLPKGAAGRVYEVTLKPKKRKRAKKAD
jgi:GNAT superfamily N-acetyltransferase